MCVAITACRIRTQVADRFKRDLYTKIDPALANGLREYLAAERKRLPEDVLFEAGRLECLLFLGYDPSFEGDEPPGL